MLLDGLTLIEGVFSGIEAAVAGWVLPTGLIARCSGVTPVPGAPYGDL